MSTYYQKLPVSNNISALQLLNACTTWYVSDLDAVISSADQNSGTAFLFEHYYHGYIYDCFEIVVYTKYDRSLKYCVSSFTRGWRCRRF